MIYVFIKAAQKCPGFCIFDFLYVVSRFAVLSILYMSMKKKIETYED